MTNRFTSLSNRSFCSSISRSEKSLKVQITPLICPSKVSAEVLCDSQRCGPCSVVSPTVTLADGSPVLSVIVIG